MKRIIKLTEKQLNEATDSGFNYLDGGDVPNYSGQTFISASGKLGIEDEYGEPVMGDKVSKTLSPQTYSRYTMGTQTYRQKTNENDTNIGINQNDKSQGTRPEDSSDIEKDEESTVLPQAVESKLEMFIKSINSTKMNPKQTGIVLNRLIDMLNVDETPFNWKKEIVSKIRK